MGRHAGRGGGRDGRDAGDARRDGPRGHGGLERLGGLHPVREALRARRRELRRLRVRAGAGHPGLAELRDLARRAGVEVEEVEGPEAGSLPAPGVLLDAGPLPALELETLLTRAAPDAGPRTLVALDGVEDPQNLGAIARVAEAAGVAGLVLTRRRAPPLSPAVSRASAGAIEWLPVARVTNLSRALDALRREGFWVLGADAEGEDSLYGLSEALAASDRVLVLGAEGQGLRSGVRRRVDAALRIPLGGHVASLNVSTAAAVLLFELRRRAGTG